MVLGDPSMLLTKLENPLFFRSAVGFVNCASPETRLGLRVPFSDLGGVTSVIGCPPGGMGCVLGGWFMPRWGLVFACIRGGGPDLVVGAEVGLFEVDCIDDKMPEASNGAPIRSLGRASEVGGGRVGK